MVDHLQDATPEQRRQLRALATTSARLARLREQHMRIATQRDELVVTLAASGLGYAVVAEAASISVGRVAQVVRAHRGPAL